MDQFRAKVRELREATRSDMNELYARANREYGSFDPLDTYTPPANGLTHADGTRVATIGDRARAEIDTLRSRVNGLVTHRLAAADVAALIAAKRRRRDAFETALARSLRAATAAHPELTQAQIGKTLAQLADLADGWY